MGSRPRYLPRRTSSGSSGRHRASALIPPVRCSAENLRRTCDIGLRLLLNWLSSQSPSKSIELGRLRCALVGSRLLRRSSLGLGYPCPAAVSDLETTTSIL